MNYYRHLNVTAAAAVITINFLANYLPLNGQLTGQVARQFRVVGYLPGFTFAIWGFIYALMVTFCVYQFLNPQTARRMGPPFIASCVFNISWIFVWHYEFIPLSFAATIGLLVSLVVAYSRLEPYQRAGKAELLSVNTLFSVYLGWLSITAVANGVILLEYLEWHWMGIEYDLWLLAAIVSSALFAVSVSLYNRDPVIPLTHAWVLTAVYLANQDATLIAHFSSAGAVLITAAAVYIALRYRIVFKQRIGVR